MGNLLNIPIAPSLKSHTVGYNRSTVLYDSLSIAEVDIVTAQSTADGKITTYRQDSSVLGIPTPSDMSNSIGDLWIDTYSSSVDYYTNNEFRFRYVGGTETIIGYSYDSGWSNYLPQSVTGKYIWEDIADLGIAQALDDAGVAQDTADFKITSWYESDVDNLIPSTTGLANKDIWFDLSSSQQNMFKYSTSYSADFTGYYWTGSTWSSYGEHSSYGTVQVWIDVDDIKIYQYKTFITVSLLENEGEYTTITAAISALPVDGGTIYIKEGIYSHSYSIGLSNKNITLYGESRENSIIDLGGGNESGLRIVDLNNKEITITNLTVRDGGSSSGKYGIYIGSDSAKTGKVTISNCIVDDFYDGIYVYGVDSVRISNNIITNVTNGGIRTKIADDGVSTIDNNEISGISNANVGIETNYIDTRSSCSGYVSNNTVSGFYYGILSYEGNSKIESNTVHVLPNVTIRRGIHFQALSGVVSNNTVSLTDTSTVVSNLICTMVEINAASGGEGISVTGNTLNVNHRISSFGGSFTILFALYIYQLDRGTISSNSIYIKDLLSGSLNSSGIYAATSNTCVLSNNNTYFEALYGSQYCLTLGGNYNNITGNHATKATGSINEAGTGNSLSNNTYT